MSKNSDAQAQLERFKETARKLGCNEDEAAFDEKLRHIARQHTPAPSLPKKQRRQAAKGAD
jgi:hypothetical protein